jgi:hypothetical protein
MKSKYHPVTSCSCFGRHGFIWIITMESKYHLVTSCSCFGRHEFIRSCPLHLWLHRLSLSIVLQNGEILVGSGTLVLVVIYYIVSDLSCCMPMADGTWELDGFRVSLWDDSRRNVRSMA